MNILEYLLIYGEPIYETFQHLLILSEKIDPETWN